MVSRVEALFLCVVFCSVSAFAQPHEPCSEDNEAVRAPLHGWIGVTNVGTPVPEMTLQAFVDPSAAPVASTTTDSGGGFSFPQLRSGKYFVRGKKKINTHYEIRTEEWITVSEGGKGMACLVAEPESSINNPEPSGPKKTKFRVTSAATAASIARAAIKQDFPDVLRRTKWLRVSKQAHRWIVYFHPYRKGETPTHGGTFEVEISARYGSVLSIRAEM